MQPPGGGITAETESILSIFLEFRIKQESQRCPKRRVAQAEIKFRNKERNVRSPVKLNVLGVLRNI